MRWQLVALFTALPLLAVHPAYAQSGKSDPLCELACWMSPSDAPASCGCKTSEAGDGPVTKPSPAPAPVTPTASKCRVICEKNPLTAPAGCDCTVPTEGSRAGTVGGGMGPAVTPKSIVADGMVSVGELLDYMIQLYRSRIAGVQRYHFLERTVVGQSSPLARIGNEPRLIPVANQQLAQNKPIKGVDTMIPGMYFLEKVMRAGHEAFKVLTPPEKAALQADMLAAPPDAKALMKNPALFFEALGMKGMTKDMTDQLESEKNDEELFAEDVLEELLALKKAFDAEATAAVLAKDAQQARGEKDAQQAGGKKKAQGLGSKRPLRVGWVRKGTLEFTFGNNVFCKSALGCTLKEIAMSIPGVSNAHLDWFAERVFCLIWSPLNGTFAIPSFAMKPGISPNEMYANLWLPFPDEVLFSPLKEEGYAGLVSSKEDVDRPIRATVLFHGRPASGSSEFMEDMLWDRVYGDFRTIKNKGEGPAMNVPHRIREQLRSATCPGSVDGDRVLTMLTSGEFKYVTKRVMEGRADQEERCAAALHTAKLNVTDRIREKFQVNKPLPSASEEARMIYEEFGCIGQASDDQASPCYGK